MGISTEIQNKTKQVNKQDEQEFKLFRLVANPSLFPQVQFIVKFALQVCSFLPVTSRRNWKKQEIERQLYVGPVIIPDKINIPGVSVLTLSTWRPGVTCRAMV